MEQYMEQFTFFGVTFYQYPELMEQWTSGPVLSNDYPLLVKKDGKFLNTDLFCAPRSQEEAQAAYEYAA